MGRKGRSFSFNRENSEEKENKKLCGVTSISQQLNSFINASTQVTLITPPALQSDSGVQVAQTVMSDLLSSPHHPAVNPNIILDNFLLDLRQSIITRLDTPPSDSLTQPTFLNITRCPLSNQINILSLYLLLKLSALRSGQESLPPLQTPSVTVTFSLSLRHSLMCRFSILISVRDGGFAKHFTHFQFCKFCFNFVSRPGVSM